MPVSVCATYMLACLVACASVPRVRDDRTRVHRYPITGLRALERSCRASPLELKQIGCYSPPWHSPLYMMTASGTLLLHICTATCLPCSAEL